MKTRATPSLGLLLALSLLTPALAQEGDGVDINMEALKNRPTGIPPLPPAPPPKPHTDKSQKVKPADRPKKFTGKSLTLVFEPGGTALSAAARKALDDVAVQSRNQRLELKSYAGTDKDSASDTRRLALQRAIAVRGYLMDKGMDGTRIAVRPQGPAHDGHGPERVDVRYLEE
jgi:outer membrane protein OmpA-like peptidoglycan-associated protein